MITNPLNVVVLAAAALLGASWLVPASANENDPPKAALIGTEKAAAASAKENDSAKAALVATEKSAAFAATRTIRHKPVVRLARNESAPSRGCSWLGCSGYTIVGVGF